MLLLLLLLFLACTTSSPCATRFTQQMITAYMHTICKPSKLSKSSWVNANLATRYADSQPVHATNASNNRCCVFYLVWLPFDMPSTVYISFHVSSFKQVHRWNRNPRHQPEKFSKLVFLMYLSQSCIFLNWLSGALVGVGGHR